MSTTVVISEENTTVSDALAAALSQLGWRVVAQVNDLESLARAVAEHKPDLVVTGSVLEDQQVAPSMSALGIGGAVAVISSDSSDGAIRTHLAAGAQGWFHLDIPLAHLVAGLEQVVEGWPSITGAAARLILSDWRAAGRSGSKGESDAIPGLTSRESEVLAAMGQGRTNKEISLQLGLAAKTVENHKTRIFTKLGARNTAHALAIAADRGLLDG